MVANLAGKSRLLQRAGKNRPSRLSANGRPTRRGSVGSSDPSRRFRRDREKKVVQQNPARKLRSGDPRPLRVRLLGGLLIYVTTLYCSPALRTGKKRGREGSGVYPELAVLGIQEGKTPALVREVARQTALLPYAMAQQELAERGLARITYRLLTKEPLVVDKLQLNKNLPQPE